MLSGDSVMRVASHLMKWLAAYVLQSVSMRMFLLIVLANECLWICKNVVRVLASYPFGNKNNSNIIILQRTNLLIGAVIAYLHFTFKIGVHDKMWA